MAKKTKSSQKKVQKERVSEGLAIACLILNVLILPGLGSIIGGKKKEGTWQIILTIGGFIVGFMLTLTIIGALVGIPMMIAGPLAGWIWGIISAINIIRESQ